MKRVLTIAILFIATAGYADELTADQFEKDYNSLETEIYINQGEVADIQDFVYQKDVATFTFKKGRMILQKPLNGRPTSAIFVGDVHVHIDVPPDVERRGLYGLTGDSVVDMSLKVLTIRFADDFDLKLKENFAFKDGGLSVAEAKTAKKDQGERFFKPDLGHYADDYFQLLRSVYERADDGYFMAGFDRWCFRFDPHLSEEVKIGYEKFRPADRAEPAAVFQRKESNAYTNLRLARLHRDAELVKDSSIIFSGGADGYKLIRGYSKADFVVLDDSIKSLDCGIAYDTRIDSLLLDGVPAIYKRRKDFSFTGIYLPRWYHRRDTVSIELFSSKGDAWGAIPAKTGVKFVDYYVSLVYPRGYNYYGTGYSDVQRYDDSLDCVTIHINDDINEPSFTCLATGADTTVSTAPTGIELDYIDRGSDPDFRLNDGTKQMLERGFEYMTKMFSNPGRVDRLFVFHGGYLRYSTSGKIYLTNDDKDPDRGGLPMHVGRAVATLWFEPKVRVLSYRDGWLRNAVPEYLALLFTREERGDRVYYQHLVACKQEIKNYYADVAAGPAASGHMPTSVESSQGVWVLHMLRCLMQDLKTGSDDKFYDFLRELIVTANLRPISTADFVELAEQHVGARLDWFFDQWLFGTCMPDYKVEYSIKQESDGYYYDFSVKTNGVADDFVMPVMIRLDFEEGSAYVRQGIGGQEYSFRMGPYNYQPKGAFFNEMLSVMSDYELKQK